tara:strand:+ start:127437 stop:128078 length:642 start_codon:yes stop_codon:yes gene_type:complete
MNPRDMLELPKLLPTTYHIANEEQTNCKGKYRSRRYNGRERTNILTPKGTKIATVCSRFAAVLAMEGTGILSKENGGMTVNWAGNYRYKVMRKCKYGLGVRGLCLLPFHTLAADNKVHRPGDIIYIPFVKESNIELPDGSLHSGLFQVRDTGGAFQGVGSKRVDMFVHTQNDRDNVFVKRNIHKPNQFKAYKLIDESKDQAIKYLREKFPEIY